ncbi:ANM_collapsed_G0036410.mRNA.1.CDS.1 [Saccharomyces cerevisiae]|nr:ANM_collapsed_G0036410.mRNA.1.CDS.1 [Saccharomyces cerevisiae]
MDMLHNKCSDAIRSTSNSNLSNEVDKQKLQYDDLGNTAFSELFEMESQDNNDNIEDFLFFNINLTQGLSSRTKDNMSTRKRQRSITHSMYRQR